MRYIDLPIIHSIIMLRFYSEIIKYIKLQKFIESSLIICCSNTIFIAQLSIYCFVLQQSKIWQTTWNFITLFFLRLIDEESRINTNLFVLQCVSFCRVLDLSCSLCPSINCLCRFHFKLMLWCSSLLVDWWEYSSIYCWTAVGGASLKMWLLWEELHWRCDCCVRSFPEGVIVVGGASLKLWLLWEELPWRSDCCGRSFTEDEIVVGGASLKVWLLWEELHRRYDSCGRSFTEGVIVVGGASLKV